MSAILSSGVASARKSSTPASSAIALAVSGLSPVIMTVLMPMRRSSSNRSRMPSLTTSLRWMTPRTRAPSVSSRATSSGVPPACEIVSVSSCASGVTVPPRSSTQATTEPVAPLRTLRPSTSTPDMRVWAVKATHSAPVSSPWWRSRRPYFSLASTTMERPSGVSSASDDSWAASATSASVVPRTGTNSEAWRLPRVMVPVLSSSSVETSPAASTARPDIARTLRWTRRSMPAMPIAESSAPMVVGIRQTSRAASTIIDCSAPAYTANGCSVTTASRKTMVSEASRMFSAISLGVFCRAAPSTRLIIRSMNVSPGFVVILMTTRSERTFVPPVTAERSPPDSRMTGADSPVIADSSTLATPSTTSPSPGITSPASQTTRSPILSSVPGTCSSDLPSGERRRATVSVLALRRVSAWALPRPSATASARFAKIVVSHSHAAIAQPNQSPGSLTARTVVSTEPTRTTNMTGDLTITRGSSFLMASGNDFSSCLGSNRPPPTLPSSGLCPVGTSWCGARVGVALEGGDVGVMEPGSSCFLVSVVMTRDPLRGARARAPGSTSDR